MDSRSLNLSSVNSHASLSRQSSAEDPRGLSPDDDGLRSRRTGTAPAHMASNQQQMTDTRPSVSIADDYVPPRRQASLSNSMNGLALEDSNPASLQAPAMPPVPQRSASATYVPMPRSHSLAPMAAAAMGIDANRGTMTREDAAGGWRLSALFWPNVPV